MSPTIDAQPRCAYFLKRFVRKKLLLLLIRALLQVLLLLNKWTQKILHTNDFEAAVLYLLKNLIYTMECCQENSVLQLFPIHAVHKRVVILYYAVHKRAVPYSQACCSLFYIQLFPIHAVHKRVVYSCRCTSVLSLQDVLLTLLLIRTFPFSKLLLLIHSAINSYANS